jgi:hypothetical protein
MPKSVPFNPLNSGLLAISNHTFNFGLWRRLKSVAEWLEGFCDRFVLALLPAAEQRGASGSPDDVVGKCVEEGPIEAGRGDGIEEAGKKCACRRGHCYSVR